MEEVLLTILVIVFPVAAAVSMVGQLLMWDRNYKKNHASFGTTAGQPADEESEQSELP